MRVCREFYLYTTLVLGTGVHACGVLSPCGIEMCKLKCQQILGCPNISFQQVELTCCFNGARSIAISNCVGDTVDVNLSKVDPAFRMTCAKGSRILVNRRNRTVCIRDSTLHGKLKNNTTKRSSGVLKIFFDACKHGHLKAIKQFLILKIVDVNSVGENGQTAAMLAVKHQSVFDHLLSVGCDLRVKDDEGMTVLHHACALSSVALVRGLISRHRDELDLEARDSSGRSPLLVACLAGRNSVSILLMSVCCDVWASDNSNATALHLASMSDSVGIVSTLVDKYDFPINLKDMNGRTAFLTAVASNSSRVLRFLSKRNCNAFAVDKNERTALHVAARKGHTHVVRQLLNLYKLDIDARERIAHRTPLALAAEYGMFETFEFLLGKGADPLVIDLYNKSIIHLALCELNLHVLRLALSRASIMVNRPDCKKRTPLMMAARYVDGLRAFQYLMKNGANTSGVDHKGYNVFHLACKSGSVEKVKMLLRLDHSPRLTTNAPGNRTGVMIAARHGRFQLFKYLFKRFAYSSRVFDKDLLQNTLFHLACKGGNLAIVKSLKRMRLYNQRRNVNNETPSGLAAIKVKDECSHD